MNYPTIDLKQVDAIAIIVENAINDPSYLNPENCPYDRKTVKTIQKLVDLSAPTQIVNKPVRGKVGRPSKGPTIPMSEVEKEIDEIRQELATLKVDGQTMETSDRIQVLKTRAALVERILGMKERVSDVKRFHSFVQTVISIMEEELDPKSRDRVIEELKQYAEE